MDVIAGQHAAVKQNRLEQAEARLKYLLNQSDIFSHFGLGGKKPTTESKKSTASEEEPTSSTGRGRKKQKLDFDEMDEDEKEIVKEEEEEENDTKGNNATKQKIQNTLLLKQPSIITGGQMRY
jgi:hypothetical protein